MKKDSLKALHFKMSDETVLLLKSLWKEAPQPCPLCGGILAFTHKKAKKSNRHWKCRSGGEVYKAINIMGDLPGR
jgi:hypothetical protein